MSCRSGSGSENLAFDWFRNLGLVLVFGFGIMVFQYGMQLRCLIRFVRGLGEKGCDFVSGVWSRCDFGDFCETKLLPLMSTVWESCKLLIVELLIGRVGNASKSGGFGEDESQSFRGGGQSLDHSNEESSGLIRFGVLLRCLIRLVCCLIRFVCGVIRFICSLLEKECDLISVLCSEYDFGDVKDSKLLSFVSTFCMFFNISILQHATADNFGEDGSKVFYDCDGDGDGGEWCYCVSREDDCGLFYDCQCQSGDFNEISDVMILREMLNAERQRADTAVVELDMERLANASAAEEAMAMILRLQSEKSLIEIEAHNYKKMAEQKMLYDEDMIYSLSLLLLEHESEQRLSEEQLRVCRQKLKVYSQESDTEQLEGLDITLSHWTLKNGFEVDYDLPELTPLYIQRIHRWTRTEDTTGSTS